MKFTKINNKPVCIDCASCKNCNKVLPLLTINNQNEFLVVKGYRVCDECWKYYKNVKFIFIFSKIILEALLSEMFENI